VIKYQYNAFYGRKTVEKRINDCLLGKHGSYILPFLWLHGEPKERLYEEILAI
jgi:hypothetical protein